MDWREWLMWVVQTFDFVVLVGSALAALVCLPSLTLPEGDYSDRNGPS